MPVKHFGIFLAYGPTVDLRKEGLGRLLGAFLKAAATKENVRFVIACPGWLRSNFLAFCEGEGIPTKTFDVVVTEGLPLIVRLYLRILARQRRRPAKSRMFRLRAWIRRFGSERRRRVERRFVAARTVLPWIAMAIYALAIGLVVLPLLLLGWFIWAGGRIVRESFRVLSGFIGPAVDRMFGMVREPGEDDLEVRLYRLMEETETQRMVRKVDTLSHVGAWLSPTAFWPEFNSIAAPGLLCVPDVLLAEFPVGFSHEPELLGNLENVERSIRGARSFVTYSSRVKWNTLVERYSVPPGAVDVVLHASWDLSPWINVRGFSDSALATKSYCEALLQQALGRTGVDRYTKRLNSGSLEFLFYPSQFRPNKNVLVLLEAYEFLVRERFIHHKLILTGDPKRYPPILNFVREHGLTREVLFLHGLTTSELAACYHLADLAINPSLSEGGCPFTFTEALSVDTPVLMARIPVTEEVLVDPALQKMMLFDPYDHNDISCRIEWGLNNREVLLSAQRETYAKLNYRTWSDVVDEYVTILDRLAARADQT